MIKESACSVETLEAWVQSLGREDPLRRKGQSTPVFLTGKSPWTEGPGGLQSVGSQRVGYNGACVYTFSIFGIPVDLKTILLVYDSFSKNLEKFFEEIRRI